MQGAEDLIVRGIEFDRSDWVKEGIALGADPNGRIRRHPGDELQPLLSYAASRDRDGQIVRALVAAGADVNARDSEGRTALHRVAGRGHQLLRLCVVARTLLELGADAKLVDAEGQTALDAVIASTTRMLARPRASRNPESPDLLVSRFLIDFLEANMPPSTAEKPRAALEQIRRQFQEELVVGSKNRQR